MTNVIAWVDFIAFHKLERDFWKFRKDGQGRVLEERASDGLWARLKWSTLFWSGYR